MREPAWEECNMQISHNENVKHKQKSTGGHSHTRNATVQTHSYLHNYSRVSTSASGGDSVDGRGVRTKAGSCQMLDTDGIINTLLSA